MLTVISSSLAYVPSDRTRTDGTRDRARVIGSTRRCIYCDTRREIFLDGKREIDRRPRARRVRQ